MKGRIKKKIKNKKEDERKNMLGLLKNSWKPRLITFIFLALQNEVGVGSD